MMLMPTVLYPLERVFWVTESLVAVAEWGRTRQPGFESVSFAS
jgi:hypothetical protein